MSYGSAQRKIPPAVLGSFVMPPLPRATDNRDVFADLYNHRKMIAILTSLTLLASTLIIFSLPRLYEAKASLLLQSDHKQLPAENVILSEIEILKSHDLAEQVQLVSKQLTVKPVGRSAVVEIEYKDKNPEIAARTVNTLVQAYRQRQIQEKQTSAEKTRNLLAQQLSQQSEKLRYSVQQVNSYRFRENLFDNTAKQQEISQLTAQLLTTQTALRTQYAELQSKYGPRHPRLQAVQSALAQTNVLQKKIDTLEQERERQEKAVIGLHDLEREAHADRTLYEDILKRYKEAALQSQTQQPDSKVISQAYAPSGPSGAPRGVIILLTTTIGFLLSLIIAVIFGQIEQEVKP